MLNAGLCAQLGEGAFQSGEDLTNLPLLPLQQDLATAALLHLPHLERNGRHYFRGLDHLPPGGAEGALAAHPNLHRPTANGVGLRLEAGRLQVGSLACPGYGWTGPTGP